jgi:Na+-transporting NADH:ubiquinone oxidoreductase subunit NqrC
MNFMFCGKNLLVFVVLLIVAISVSGCSYLLPEETKEVKLEKKRDELVEAKLEAEKWRKTDYIALADFNYRVCLDTAAFREEREEEPKECKEKKELLLKASRMTRQNADDKVDEIRRAIQELEQSEPTIENK